MISTDSPLEFLIAIVTFVVAIGVLVAVHEFGHFWAARRLGIRVLRFSIGFGRPLWKRVHGRDAVEYVVAAIPLGGYVKMLDEREGDVAPHELPRTFNRQPVWKRIIVLLAGPASNLIFAILLYWVLFAAGVPGLRPIVGVVAPDSIAARADLREEDEILAVAGTPTPTLEAVGLRILEDLIDDGTIRLRVRGKAGEERTLTLYAGDRSRELTQPGALLAGLGFDIWRPRVAAIVGRVMPGSAGERAGLREGDEILAFDGEPVGDFAALVGLVEPGMGRTVELELRRDGRILELPITIGEDFVAGRPVGRIGIAPANQLLPSESGLTVQDMLAVQKYGMLAAVRQAAAKTWDTSLFTLRIIGRMVTGNVSLKAISGPISIAETTGYAARQGWRIFLSTLALISISLGVLNLLPIPILDGGQIVYQLAELVKGRPVSERAQLLGQQIGIMMLILVMSLAFYNDIARHLN
ncbi:regulator of sigma E protease [Steroidobacter denitrificans]|uniref:Zinc metalloprotease n=1 Tax=Steroidobacter denitrificans TaxID=465721 RepID=A0A127FAA7_STEDE|nr:RIP metalloprotease RseP [Steroidobacter denitrificans]AMN47354.1 regulator of sigma E protease [Steroidobacter denitrificans]